MTFSGHALLLAFSMYSAASLDVHMSCQWLVCEAKALRIAALNDKHADR